MEDVGFNIIQKHPMYLCPIRARLISDRGRSKRLESKERTKKQSRRKKKLKTDKSMNPAERQ